jgi:hypothetical protein
MNAFDTLFAIAGLLFTALIAYRTGLREGAGFEIQKRRAIGNRGVFCNRRPTVKNHFFAFLEICGGGVCRNAFTTSSNLAGYSDSFVACCGLVFRFAGTDSLSARPQYW